MTDNRTPAETPAEPKSPTAAESPVEPESPTAAESPVEPESPTQALPATDATEVVGRPSIMEAADRLAAEETAAASFAGTSTGPASTGTASMGTASTAAAASPSWYEDSLRDEAVLRSEPAPAPAPYPTATEPPVAYSPGVPEQRPQRSRVGTIVWGLVLVLLGAAVVAIGLGVELDLEVFLIGLLGIAGLGLLVGTAISALRGR